MESDFCYWEEELVTQLEWEGMYEAGNGLPILCSPGDKSNTRGALRNA